MKRNTEKKEDFMSYVKRFIVNGDFDRDTRGRIGVIIHKIENRKPLTVSETNLFHHICDMIDN